MLLEDVWTSLLITVGLPISLGLFVQILTVKRDCSANKGSKKHKILPCVILCNPSDLFFFSQLSLTLFCFILKRRYAALIAALCTGMLKHIPSLHFFIKNQVSHLEQLVIYCTYSNVILHYSGKLDPYSLFHSLFMLQ